ncbi:MAG: hypothetical protein ABI880_15100, partial [Acidobacteriota bacterium]
LSATGAGQLVVTLDGVEDLTTVVGRATGTTQFFASSVITITQPSTVLSVRNGLLSAGVLTVTPSAGGGSPVAAHLLIKRLQ